MLKNISPWASAADELFKNNQMIYCDCPLARFKVRKNKATFNVLGDSRLSCELMVVKHKENLHGITIAPQIKSKHTKDGHLAFIVNGNQTIKMSW